MSNTNRMISMYKEHHQRIFEKYGETAKGVDWGDNPQDHISRLDKMLSVVQNFPHPISPFTILDVGCGYGRLLERAIELQLPANYTGIEIVDSMLSRTRDRNIDATWIHGDALIYDFKNKFDYVVTNGTLTQKLDATIPEMEEFTKSIIKKMFSLCNKGIAFNLMSNHVNFMVPNLYYTSPLEMIGWCMSEVSTKVRVDHAYPLYEYTIYLYK